MLQNDPVVSRCLIFPTLHAEFFTDEVEFTDAVNRCAARRMTLARIGSVQENNAIGNEIKNNNDERRHWIGVQEQEQGRDGDTDRFTFVDQTTDDLPFIHVNQGSFPWKNGEPNDQFNEDCVE